VRDDFNVGCANGSSALLRTLQAECLVMPQELGTCIALHAVVSLLMVSALYKVQNGRGVCRSFKTTNGVAWAGSLHRAYRAASYPNPYPLYVLESAFHSNGTSVN
jgi:hypothetical protein